MPMCLNESETAIFAEKIAEESGHFEAVIFS
jgi:hypothetical protein